MSFIINNKFHSWRDKVVQNEFEMNEEKKKPC